MRKIAVSAIIAVMLLASCATPSPIQQEISKYYSMVYDIGFDAFNPIAEQYIETGDRVLLVNVGQGFEGTISRYEYDQPDNADPFSLAKYLDDRPFFTEYFEKGVIKSVLQNQGRGFERLSLAPYMSLYSDWLIENELIFNTSPLMYNRWEDLQKEFNVNKILVYTINKVVDEEIDYVGIQVGMKFIDIDEQGRILHDSIENVVSLDFPDDRLAELDRYYLEIPEDSINDFEAGLAEVLSEEGIRGGLDAVLMKSDDIPTLGNYPVTVEDFILEQSLTNSLTTTDSLTVLEKLFKRHYKKSWQLTNAIFNINPFRGGEYNEFENYYNTQYMLSYKTIWSEQTGEIENVISDKVNLDGKILGVYLKLIDMSDYGRIVYSHFLPIGSQSDLDANFLYKCFTRSSGVDMISGAIDEQGVVSDSEKSVVINERMEIFKHHLLSNTSAYEAMYNLFATKKNTDILEKYDKLYKLFDFKTAKETKGDIYYILAVHLMNSWFEEGLGNRLVNDGYYVVDKLESIYSRYLISEKYGRASASTNIFLSPLLLEEWGSNIKDFYDIDKVFYYIPMEKAVRDSSFVTPELIAGQSTAPEISQYYPILSYELEKMLFSILDVQTGDYLFNRNFDLEGGE